MTALPMAKNATAIWWLFKAGVVLVILLAVVKQSDAAGRSLTSSELFFYQGADREQILLEGAKKEGQLVFTIPIPGSSPSRRSSRGNIPS
jgi:hypothetical protein